MNDTTRLLLAACFMTGVGYYQLCDLTRPRFRWAVLSLVVWLVILGLQLNPYPEGDSSQSLQWAQPLIYGQPEEPAFNIWQ